MQIYKVYKQMKYWSFFFHKCFMKLIKNKPSLPQLDGENLEMGSISTSFPEVGP